MCGQRCLDNNLLVVPLGDDRLRQLQASSQVCAKIAAISLVDASYACVYPVVRAADPDGVLLRLYPEHVATPHDATAAVGTSLMHGMLVWLTPMRRLVKITLAVVRVSWHLPCLCLMLEVVAPRFVMVLVEAALWKLKHRVCLTVSRG